jgi:hypothetical protein
VTRQRQTEVAAVVRVEEAEPVPAASSVYAPELVYLLDPVHPREY